MSRKLIVILGPTASGKSELAVKLTKKLAPHRTCSGAGFNGEIISADSRQVYKGMDIGTGKITQKEMKGVPHHLLDVALPKRRFSVAQYQKKAKKIIKQIQKRNKLPILCGGTGFYIQAVVDGIVIPGVLPDWQLRKKLEKKSEEELFEQLKKLNPQRAKTIESKNKRRLIRALEIIKKIGRIPILEKRPLPYPVLIIGIKKGKEGLEKLIKKRFFKWLGQGLLKEVRNLKKSGLSWKRIEDFGIHYRVIAQYLQNKITYQKMIENSIIELQNYAKRQMTWFKRDPRIHWINNYDDVKELVKNFLEK